MLREVRVELLAAGTANVVLQLGCIAFVLCIVAVGRSQSAEWQCPAALTSRGGDTCNALISFNRQGPCKTLFLPFPRAATLYKVKGVRAYTRAYLHLLRKIW